MDRLGPRVRSVSSKRRRSDSRSRTNANRRSRVERSEDRKTRTRSRHNRDDKPRSKSRKTRSHSRKSNRSKTRREESESDYETDITAGPSHKAKVQETLSEGNDQEAKAANKSMSDEDDDEIMILDELDIPPADISHSNSSSDTEEDEKAIQALIDKVAMQVRSEFLKGKAEKKKKKTLEKQEGKKKN